MSHCPPPGLSPQYISQLEEETPALRTEVEQLQQHILEPREILFADILLRRPKYVTTVQHSGLREVVCVLGRASMGGGDALGVERASGQFWA